MTIQIKPKVVPARTLYRVREIPTLPEFSWLTESSLRHMIFQSEPRVASNGDVIAGNGMIEVGVIKRIGRRILIDINKLRLWVVGTEEFQNVPMDMS